MLSRDAVLQVVQTQGPCLPIHIKKAIGAGDTMAIGAILSELKEAGKVCLTMVKRGGSPFYYAPGQEERLVSLIDDLGEKDKRTAQLLQEQQVLKDATQEPLTRFSLRQIRDFAKSVEVQVNDEVVLYWKWYLLPDEEVASAIKKGRAAHVSASSAQNTASVQNTASTQNADAPSPALAPSTHESTVGRSVPAPKQQGLHAYIPPAEETTAKAADSAQSTAIITQNAEQPTPDSPSEQPEEKPAKQRKKRTSKPKPPVVTEEVSASVDSAQNTADGIQNTATQTTEHSAPTFAPPAPPSPPPEDPFVKRTLAYFAEKGIGVTSQAVVKRGKEADFLISIPTPVGAMPYFCKAKDKQKSNEGDLSAAFLTGQGKKLPVLYLTTGDVTPKARAMLQQECKGMTVVRF